MNFRKRLVRKLRRRWFLVFLTALVALAATGAVLIAATIPVPDPVPDYALNAEPVYRAQVGGAWFAVVYLVIIAMALAFDGRGFIRFGPQGVEAGELRKTREAGRKSWSATDQLRRGLAVVRTSLLALKTGLGDLSKRHDHLAEEVSAQAARIDGLEKTVRRLQENRRS